MKRTLFSGAILMMVTGLAWLGCADEFAADTETVAVGPVIETLGAKEVCKVERRKAWETPPCSEGDPNYTVTCGATIIGNRRVCEGCSCVHVIYKDAERLAALVAVFPDVFEIKGNSLVILVPSRERVDLATWQGQALLEAAVRNLAESNGRDFELRSEFASITRYHVEISAIDGNGDRVILGGGQNDDLAHAVIDAAIRWAGQ